jgi:hypothetical protein
MCTQEMPCLYIVVRQNGKSGCVSKNSIHHYSLIYIPTDGCCLTKNILSAFQKGHYRHFQIKPMLNVCVVLRGDKICWCTLSFDVISIFAMYGISRKEKLAEAIFQVDSELM